MIRLVQLPELAITLAISVSFRGAQANVQDGFFDRFENECSAMRLGWKIRRLGINVGSARKRSIVLLINFSTI
jgi:hypothetical protein